MSWNARIHRLLLPALLLSFVTSSAFAQSGDRQAVARNLVKAGMVKPNDKVLVTGSARDMKLLEDIAIEVMKAGAEPLISVQSEGLIKRSYAEVPAIYDSVTPPLSLVLSNIIDVQIALDVGETEGLIADVPIARRLARTKAAEPVIKAFLEKKARYVNLGNGLYPNATLARRLGVTEDKLATVFWRAAAASPAEIKAKGEATHSIFAAGKQVTMTHPNGTNLTFAVDAGHAFVSDGMLTPEKVAQSAAAASTWLPAGEMIFPAQIGSANGKIVIDKQMYDGKMIEGLTFNVQSGKLTSISGKGVEALRAAYDAAGAGKDVFGYIDIGINPQTTLPVGMGRIVWGAPGSVAFGFGDNRGFGGSNASEFGIASQLGGVTLKVDGKTVIENGALK